MIERLHHGDWREIIDGLAVDHTITDPPFTDHVSKNQRRSGKVVKGRQVIKTEDLSFLGCQPSGLEPIVGLTKRWALFFCAIEQIGDYKNAFLDHYVRGCAWEKPDATPQFTGDRPAMWGECIAVLHPPGKKRWNGGGKRGLYTYNTCRESDRFHETQKPLPLMIELIEDFTDPGDLIFDPFMGSGTTGVACILTGRRFIGCEMQEGYFKRAKKRLEAAQIGLKLDDYEAGQTSLLAL